MKSKSIVDKIDKIQGLYDGTHISKVIRIAPLKENGRLRIGSPVITPRGLGTIQSHWPHMWTGEPGDHIQVRMEGGYFKSFRVHELTQLAVYHKPTKQFILLSPTCYKNIGVNDQMVGYRVTKRKYAMLTDETKELTEHYVIVNRVRNGRSILKTLNKEGYVIKRVDDSSMIFSNAVRSVKGFFFNLQYNVIEKVNQIKRK